MDGIYSTESGGVTEGKMDARDKDEIRQERCEQGAVSSRYKCTFR